MQEFLREYSVEVLFAENGLEGLKLMEANQDLSLVITDLNMPVLHGFEMITMARKNSEINKIPFIILTGEPIDTIAEKARELDVYFIFRKPLRSFDHLKKLLDNFFFNFASCST